MKRISEITRRDVFNLFLYGIDKNTDFGTELLHYNYSGKLSELDFLKRIYNLEHGLLMMRGLNYQMVMTKSF